MSDALAAKIAHVQALLVCRSCGRAITPDVVLCACRIERGELPHTEWPREMKRFLLVRAIERKRGEMSEQYLWRKLLLDEYAGSTVGEGTTRRVLSRAITVVDAFPFAAGDAAAWTAAGCPTSFTI